MNITEMVVKLSLTGAGHYVMLFMVFLSIVSVAVMIERLAFFMMNKDNVRDMAVELNKLFLNGEYDKANKLLADAKGFEARVLSASLEVAHLGKGPVREMAASASGVEKLRFERGLTLLGTLGNNAPFIGLFGTVIEIIAALSEMGTQSAANASSGQVMATLSAALAATAVGLIVALPAVFMFNIFTRKIKTLQTGADALVHVLLAHLKETEEES
ncbi:MAG: MotA/TolQ/ExbB proton channel family protein [Deltaproteobacteria bacterium]|nr:MotA/TolQ/ExbB proton channel family protein [Deltaproteobacteria bacterium]